MITCKNEKKEKGGLDPKYDKDVTRVKLPQIKYFQDMHLVYTVAKTKNL